MRSDHLAKHVKTHTEGGEDVDESSNDEKDNSGEIESPIK
jgi:hypothetical protein